MFRKEKKWKEEKIKNLALNNITGNKKLFPNKDQYMNYAKINDTLIVLI